MRVCPTGQVWVGNLQWRQQAAEAASGTGTAKTLGFRNFYLSSPSHSKKFACLPHPETPFCPLSLPPHCLSVQVGSSEIVGRVVEDLKDESEPYRCAVFP